VSPPQAAAKRRQDNEPRNRALGPHQRAPRHGRVPRLELAQTRSAAGHAAGPTRDGRAVFIESVLTIASSSDSRRDIGSAADQGQVTMEASVVNAREHRGGARAGAGVIEEDNMVKGIARGVVVSDVEEILDHTRAVVAPQVQDEVNRVGDLVRDCACAQRGLPPTCPREWCSVTNSTLRCASGRPRPRARCAGRASSILVCRLNCRIVHEYVEASQQAGSRCSCKFSAL
jgi:hypothetical protein